MSLSAPTDLIQIAALLRAQATAIRAETAALGDALCRWRPAEVEWRVNEVLGHLNHVKQMLSNVQAYVWPRMGNAGRKNPLASFHVTVPLLVGHGGVSSTIRSQLPSRTMVLNSGRGLRLGRAQERVQYP